MNHDLSIHPRPELVLLQGGPAAADTDTDTDALGFPPGWTVRRKGSGWSCVRGYEPGVMMPAQLFGDDLDELRRCARALPSGAA